MARTALLQCWPSRATVGQPPAGAGLNCEVTGPAVLTTVSHAAVAPRCVGLRTPVPAMQMYLSPKPRLPWRRRASQRKMRRLRQSRPWRRRLQRQASSGAEFDVTPPSCWIISRSERAGIRTYVSTIRIPLRRISETGLGEPSSTALRSILRQIMTGFGELSSLMETEADAEGAVPDPPPAYRVHSGEEARPQEQLERHGADGQGTAGGSGDEERTRVGGVTAEGRGTARDTNNLVENGTLPILRLAHFFLLNEDEDDEHPHGLTKEQIDNLSTRTYGQASTEGELGRTCSVCINEYAQGNKLRRLPCAHEFHIHCIDRWLSQNNTCPICRQPILATDSAPST
ncbi:hypothetical protein GJAV_G00069490 [Gymnothorax javanicus]|nr:hypothetical protein GJAV_G00069490 [Gymnothorax javanicus]